MKPFERTSAAAKQQIACISVTYRGVSPYDALEGRIRSAMDSATVRRMSDGSYHATTPTLAPLYGEGKSRRDALSDLWESCRWLLADPVLITFEAAGRTYTAEVLAERYGGYTVKVPEIEGCFTCGQTMEEVRRNVVEAAEIILESQAVHA